MIISDLDREVYEWDVSNVPSGEYLLKVVASDGYDEGEVVLSSPITISSTIPGTNQENPFGEIPGYSTEIMFISSISLIFVVSLKIKKKIDN